MKREKRNKIVIQYNHIPQIIEEAMENDTELTSEEIKSKISESLVKEN